MSTLYIPSLRHYLASHLDVKVVLVAVAAAKVKLLALIRRPVVEVPSVVALAGAPFRQ